MPVSTRNVTKSENLRAVVYCRVSHDPTGRGRSVDEQRAECEATAAREGWEVVDILVDNDVSASRYGRRARPGWEKVRSLIAAGAVDVLVTWEASRAERDLGAYNALRDLCAEHHVRWHYGGTTLDLEESGDRFRSGLDALVAEKEAADTSDRIRRSTRAAAVAGQPHGRILYGYRRRYDPTTRELLAQEIDPETAEVVRECARKFLAGESSRSIANDLNARGIPTPTGRGQWSLRQIRRMLTTPAYAARRVHQGQVVGPANWPAILDPNEFDTITAKFDDPSRYSVRRSPTVRLLSGVARCGVCAAPMRYAKQGGRTRPHRLTYSCSGKHCTARDLEHLENYVVAVVLARLARPDVAEQMTTDRTRPGAVAARAEVAALRTRLADAVAEFTAGHLTGGTLARVEETLLPQIADAERRTRIDAVPTVARDLAGSADIGDTWDALTREQQREILRSLVTVTVHRVAVRGRKTFDPDAVTIEWK